MNNTLFEYGPDFQNKCVMALMLDKMFLEQASDIIRPAYFESDANQWLVKTILEHYQHYKDVVTLTVLGAEGRKIQDDVLKVTIKSHLRQVFAHEKSGDLQYVKDQFLDFCRTQAVKNALEQSAELVEAGKRDEVQQLINKASTAGLALDFGHDYFEEADDRLKVDFRHTIATPWECINETMKGGGLGPGELGCVLAPTGCGKSWFLAAIGLCAVKLGKRVVHITLEMSKFETGNRYDCLLTGINANDIPQHADDVRREVLNLKALHGGHLHIPFYPGGTITSNTILALLQRMRARDQKPDVVIVDYADRLRSVQKAKEHYQELGFIYDELVSVFQQMEVVGWTATQAQRSATNKEVVEADNIANSFAKLYSTTFMMTLSRKVTDKMANTGRIHIAKNRFGQDGDIFQAHIEFERGIINVFREDSPEALQIRQQVAEAERKKKNIDRLDLQNRFIEFSKTAPETPSHARSALTTALQDDFANDDDNF